jgi:hypothetical protein
MLASTMLAGSLLVGGPAIAQMTDVTQTTPHVAGGQIGKSLAQQIGVGQGDVMTPRSSVYVIKRDPARSIRRGRMLFQRKFTEEQGQGPRVDNGSSGDIGAVRMLGAGMVDSCAGCHGRPRGAAGFGGDVATRPDSRDAPHLFGLGLVEQIAEEITADLRQQKADALAAAVNGTPPVQSEMCARNPSHPHCRATPPGPRTVDLESKGIQFGRLTALPNGTVDTSEVEGVNADLRVKPFFHEGGTISMREFVIGAFKAEMGLESPDSVLCAVTEPNATTAITTPSGFVYDPTQDTFERPPVCGVSVDGDGDGVANEIPTALIDHFEFYLLNYFKPGLGRQTSRTQQGLVLMHQIGCTSCHKQDIRIESDRRVADVETLFDPRDGIFNRLFATAETRFESVADGFVDPNDGVAHAILQPQGQPFLVENIFADFKRHDLGPAFHEREYNDDASGGTTRVTEFMTEPLWGVGSTGPYGHDGRSINIEEVILRHGGEAERARNRFAQLDDNDRTKILEFLNTLVLFPPDDTASNLNPGNPRTQDPQTPAQHGSINLGALFQLGYEGAE